MNPATAKDPSVLFDKDGFVINPEQWDIALAQRIANSEGLGDMDDMQQQLLLTLRDEFHKFGAITALSQKCHLNGLDADCLHQRFHTPHQTKQNTNQPKPNKKTKTNQT